MNKIVTKNFKNEIGNKYGRLLVIDRGENDRVGNAKWICRCDCGIESLVKGWALRSGMIVSCGCYNREIVSKTHTIHGMTKKHPKLFNIWKGMVRRCTNPKAHGFQGYGGRGIEVCDRWSGDAGLINFYNDMFPTWVDGLTLERINNNKGYSPDNCKWATRKEQSYNRRSNRKLMFEGVEYSPRSLSEKFGIKFHTVRTRLRNGWTVEQIVTHKKGSHIKKRGCNEITKLVYNHKEYTAKELSKILNINLSTLQYRVRESWSIEKIINTPVQTKQKVFLLETSPQ